MSLDDPIYNFVPARGSIQPILVSSPHSGVEFPEEVKKMYLPGSMESPEDTDWYIDKLYDFVPDMGISLVSARFSRYLIDLNRSPDNVPLYDDGRSITQLVPEKSFSGKTLWGQPLSSQEITRRKELYYQPYYDKIEQELGRLREKFDRVLFFDAHSILSRVPGISSEPFPELIIGDQDGRTCDSDISNIAVDQLSSKGFTFSKNSPFKGGHLTRFFGRPDSGVNSLQLEMCKSNYLDEINNNYLPERAHRVRVVLKKMFEELIQKLIA